MWFLLPFQWKLIEKKIMDKSGLNATSSSLLMKIDCKKNYE